MTETPPPGSGGNRFDAVERLRRKLEGMKAAATGSFEAADRTSKLTRLPRRPRRTTEEAGERPHKTWRSDGGGGSVYDPAPTRPVLRSELERETGWWPVDAGPAPDADSGSAENDGSVIDLASRRRRDAPAGGIRRVARPRRIRPAGEGSVTDEQGGDPESPRPH